MTAISIQISDALRKELEARAAQGGFDSVESYVQATLIADAAGPAVDEGQIESLLLERADGPFVETGATDFEQIRAKLDEH